MTDEDIIPPCCIVFDRDFPKRPFWLRVEKPNGINIVELEDANGYAQSLPAAVQAAIRLGYDPTHSIEGKSRPFPIPASVIRKPGSAPKERPKS